MCRGMKTLTRLDKFMPTFKMSFFFVGIIKIQMAEEKNNKKNKRKKKKKMERR